MNLSAISGWVLTAAALLLGAGCAGDSSAEDGSDESTEMVPEAQVAAVREALAPVADAFCRQRFGCCTNGELAATFGQAVPDATTCSSNLLDRAQNTPYVYLSNAQVPAAFRVLGWFAYGFSLQHTSIDPAAVEACVAELDHTGCTARPSGDFCVAQPVRTSDACDPKKLFVGTLEQGDVCNTNGLDTDCKPGLFCSAFDSPRGVCLPYLKEGDLCFANYYDNCAPELICDPQRGVCSAGLSEGQPCGYVNPEMPRQGTELSTCAQGLSCDTTRFVCTDSRCYSGKTCNAEFQCPQGDICFAGYCQSLLKDGEVCIGDASCENGKCNFSPQIGKAFCGGIFADGGKCLGSQECKSGFCKFEQGETGTCTAPGAIGSECQQGLAGVCLNGLCSFSEESVSYVCTAAGGEGDACQAGTPCQDDFLCIHGACHRTALADGSACGLHSDCLSAQCLEGVCTRGAAEGTTCTLNGGTDIVECGGDLYCARASQLSIEGTCQKKLRHGEPCTEHYQCWQSCEVMAGKRLCTGVGPTDAFCSGR